MKIVFVTVLVLLWSDCHAGSQIHVLPRQRTLSRIVDVGSEVQGTIAMQLETLDMLKDQKEDISDLEGQNHVQTHKLADHTKKLQAITAQNQKLTEIISAQEIKMSALDEKLRLLTDVPEGAECHLSGGNYTCVCKKPYEGDGHTCKLKCQQVAELGCLTLVETSMTWEDSRKYCRSQNMRLLEDISVREQFRDIMNAFNSSTWIWIGSIERHWLTSGNLISEHVYHKGQPNGKGNSSCMMIQLDAEPNENEGLYDYTCSYKGYPICQFLTSN